MEYYVGHIMGRTIFETISTPYCPLWAQLAWWQTLQQAWEHWSQRPQASFCFSRLQEDRAAQPSASAADHRLTSQYLITQTLSGRNRTFVKRVKISLIPKVSSHNRALLMQQTFFPHAASTGDVEMQRADRGCKNTGSLLLSINTCHLLLLKNL